MRSTTPASSVPIVWNMLRATRALLGDVQHLRLGLVEHFFALRPSGL